MKRSELPPRAITIDESGHIWFLARGTAVLGAEVSIENKPSGANDLVLRIPIPMVDLVPWATLQDIAAQETASHRSALEVMTQDE